MHLLLVPFCDTTAGIGAEMKCDMQTDVKTDTGVKIQNKSISQNTFPNF